ncbi:hypothetical protein HD553DRAFT_342978 [Filobasidium floriforme]|uniref:uncharacterized protein n=1 Tax=Filobasidium floriforme TaxID=5210 RepID=UPI001E8E1257|nr:uncharacterized protein HD553DRAFT_345368 [Filobasidium floriforme]XP_046036135.1 uncharacterized protein HD553DRAFT_342978 [Filobasidium floriforme]KAH8079608.1 hypothetical protein HD553DRAFT_345368 [Filobasidium floriforme]KAH8083744.1 hypothetical protein HD553DRAFT_342978 [Filobasidium floriforme]
MPDPLETLAPDTLRLVSSPDLLDEFSLQLQKLPHEEAQRICLDHLASLPRPCESVFALAHLCYQYLVPNGGSASASTLGAVGPVAPAALQAIEEWATFFHNRQNVINMATKIAQGWKLDGIENFRHDQMKPPPDPTPKYLRALNSLLLAGPSKEEALELVHTAWDKRCKDAASGRHGGTATPFISSIDLVNARGAYRQSHGQDPTSSEEPGSNRKRQRDSVEADGDRLDGAVQDSSGSGSSGPPPLKKSGGPRRTPRSDVHQTQLQQIIDCKVCSTSARERLCTHRETGHADRVLDGDGMDTLLRG